MKIGLIGPSEGDIAALREATEFLLSEAEADQIIYLGADDAMKRVTADWSADIMDGSSDPRAFLDRAAVLAQEGSPEDILHLLDADAKLKQLANIRTLPPSPSRAIEMLADRILLVVHDKGVLDEEDIANAHVIVYGKSDEILLKKFGSRHFFTPGPLAARKIAVIEITEDESIALSVFDPSGESLWREPLQSRTTKLHVSP